MLATQLTERQCAVWAGPEQIHLVRQQMPELIPGSIIIKVQACAICGSDLRTYRDGSPRITPPQIIGHEIAGEVYAIGNGVTSFKIGDRVSIGADIPCGECHHCVAGRGNCCDINYAIGYQFEGGFAEYMRLDPLVVQHGPIRAFSSSIDFAVAALAEPLACCINGYERGLIQPNSHVVIFGAGPIGLMLAMLAPIYAAKQVILIDPNEKRLQFAKEIVAATMLNPNQVDIVKTVFDMTNGRGAEMIFTACPIVATHEQAVAMVAKRGVVNFFGGLPKSAPPIQVSSNFIHYREAYLTGSHGSTPAQHARALELIESNQVNVKALITHRYSLSAMDEAFTMARSGDALKVVVMPHV